ncbi:MAG: capsular biosynthesis protein [Sphingomonadales bacterium]|nr:MAG: capsular biosynthesis protein [Sphingomonadales bacterium]TNF05692.1 MAG: capsular biosynthesis protein [Sphingomonadales bacterium]
MTVSSSNTNSPKIVIDLDGTLTVEDSQTPYPDKKPNLAVIETLRTYKEMGFTIIIHTARNMRTYDGNVGLINANTLPIIIEWLNYNEVPYDEIIVGKPWSGNKGFYVDDRAIRPEEFTSMSHAEICALLGDEAFQ